MIHINRRFITLCAAGAFSVSLAAAQTASALPLITRELIREMAGTADVLVENFKPGVMGEMGMDWPVLSARNPKLVFASITGFGQDGPDAPRPRRLPGRKPGNVGAAMTGSADLPSIMPAAFIGHGSPMNAMERNRYTAAWTEFGRSVPRPRAILVISAHWYINATAVTAQARSRSAAENDWDTCGPAGSESADVGEHPVPERDEGGHGAPCDGEPGDFLPHGASSGYRAAIPRSAVLTKLSSSAVRIWSAPRLVVSRAYRLSRK